MDIRRLKQKSKYFYPISVTSAIYDPNIKDTNEQLLSQEEINKTIYSNIEDIQSKSINDVQIDGTSIVNTKIANIDYLKKGEQILIKADTDTVHAIVTSGKVDLGDSNAVDTSNQVAIGTGNTLAADKGHSYTLGYNNNVSGGYTTVVGIRNTDSKPSVSGYKAIFGYNNTSSGYSGLIAGIDNNVTNDYNYVIGKGNVVGSTSSTVVGYSNTTNTDFENNNIFGAKNTSKGNYLNIVGHNNVVGGGSTNVIGFNNNVNVDSSSSCLSNAIGYGITIAKNSMGTALGRSITLNSSTNAVGYDLSCDETSSSSSLFGANLHIYHAKQSMLLGVKNFINDEAKTSISSSELFAFGWQNQFFDDYDTSSLHNLRNTSIGITNHTYTGELSFIYGYDNELYRTSMCEAIGSSNTIGSKTVNTIESSAFGSGNVITNNRATTFGFYLKAVNEYETALGHYNDSISGDTIFSVGNGYYNRNNNSTYRHNLIKANRDGDLYIVEKTNTDGDTTNFYERPMKRLQTWLNEKVDLYDLDSYSKKLTTTTSSDLAITLKPNANVDITCNSNLTITLEAPTDENIVNVYMCTITTGEDSGTVTLPSDVTWNEEMTIEASSFYEINIRYSGGSYFGIIHKWSN